MSPAGGAVSSSSTSMGFDEEKGEKSSDEREGSIKRSSSEASLSANDQDDEDDASFQLGPQYTLKEQLEKDKDDESLRRWKEQLLGAVDINNVEESADPEVKIISLSILSPGRPAIVLPIPEDGKPKGLWFTLKEGRPYSLRFSFQVHNNIVVGFRYTHDVWKTGVKVDSEKLMLGTFSPQPEPYTFDVPEETTPSGYFARGQYSAKSKFIDDDNKCYLKIHIPSTSGGIGPNIKYSSILYVKNLASLV